MPVIERGEDMSRYGEWKPKVWKPSQYLYITYGDDLYKIRRLFSWYDYSQLTQEEKEEQIRWNDPYYLKELLRKLYDIYDEAWDNLRDLEFMIEHAEKEHGIKIVRLLGEEKQEDNT
jgi:hypothetical protein